MTGDLDHRIQRMKTVLTARTAELVVREADFLIRAGFEPVEVVGWPVHIWRRGGTLYTRGAAMKEVSK